VSALQAAVIAALQADEGVAALVGGRVLEEAQAAAVFPYLAIGPWKSRAWNAGGARGEEVVFGIVAFVRKGGRGAALNLIGRCGVALDGAAISFDGGRVVGVFFQDAEVVLEKDRQTWRAVGKFRVLVEAT
jgi:hypothetical protein